MGSPVISRLYMTTRTEPKATAAKARTTMMAMMEASILFFSSGEGGDGVEVAGTCGEEEHSSSAPGLHVTI